MRRRGFLLATGGVTLVWAVLVLLIANSSAKVGANIDWLEGSEMMYVEESDTVIGPTTTFTVAVKITDTVDLGAFEFELVYSPTLLLVDEVSLGPLLGSTGRTVVPLGPQIDNVVGQMSYGAFTFGLQTGPDGMGTLAIITFTSTLAEGVTTLDLRNVQTTDTDANARIPIALDSTIVTDDDAEGPYIAIPEYLDSVSVDEPLVITVSISDAGTGSHGVASATLFYGYSVPYTESSVEGVGPGGNGDGVWTFTIPPQGAAHDGQTLRFLLEAVDGDNSPATSVQDNEGSGFPVNVGSLYDGIAHVQRIKLRYSLVGKSRYKVTAEVRIVDEGGQAVSGATVHAQWELPSGSLQDQESETKTPGTARFTVSSTQTGSYEICVTDVVKDGWLYDPEQNVRTCDSLTVN